MRFKTALFGMACAGGAAWMLAHRPPAEATEPGPHQIPTERPHRSRPLEMPWFSQRMTEPMALPGETANQPVVTVHVVDDNGRPIAGVLVETAVNREEYLKATRAVPIDGVSVKENNDAFLAVAAARSSREGTVLARVLPEVTTVFRVREENRAGQSEQVVVSAADAPQEVTLEVQESGALIGRVLDEHGRPISGAAVATNLREADADQTDGEGGGTPGNVLTDLNGEYRLALAPGLFAVEISATHRQKFMASAVQVLPGRESRLEARLDPAVEIHGTVMGPNGEAVPGASVDALSETGATSGVVEAGGTFALEGLAPGKYLLRVTAEGFLGEDLPDIEAGGDPLTIRLGAAGRIVGEVQFGPELMAALLGPDDSDIAEVGSTRISIEGVSENGSFYWGSSAPVDRSGHATFSAGSLPPGTYQAVVTFGDTVTSSGDLKVAAGEEVHVELKAPEGSGGALDGVVRGPQGTPATSGEVSLRGMGATLSTQIGADGRYHFAGVPAGQLEVWATVIVNGKAYGTGVSTTQAFPRRDLTLDLSSVAIADPVVPSVQIDNEPLVLTDPTPDELAGHGPPDAGNAAYQPAIQVTWEGDTLLVLHAPSGDGGNRLRPGDQITSIDDVTLAGAQASEGGPEPDPLTGAEGTPCRITVTRPASGETLVVVLPRTQPVVEFAE